MSTDMPITPLDEFVIAVFVGLLFLGIGIAAISFAAFFRQEEDDDD